MAEDLVTIARQRVGTGHTPTNMVSALATAVVSVGLLCASAASAQSNEQSSGASQAPAITVRSNLVLVPALVKTKTGEIVFSLTADDFILTDNGTPQALRLELDTDSQPLALAVIVQTGGLGAEHLRDYRDLSAVLDAVIGDVSHRVAVVSFDSTPRLEQDFSTDTDAAAKTIATLDGGDAGAAILDALNFGINLLRKQPPAYRRAVVLFSETIDSGSQTSFEDALRAVDDANTAIYSFGFSSTKAAVNHEASKLPRQGGSPYSDVPYAPGGCMSKDPNADPDAHGKRGVQALDCASDLLPPLRLARMAFLAAKDGFRRNVPESVAQLTGGEYFAFKSATTLSRHLITISNDVPNYYVLSFRPQSPQPGLHALELKLKDRPELQVSARNAYWVDAEVPANNK
jgi:VWFA-related protein